MTLRPDNFSDPLVVGQYCFDFATSIFGICRSITGEGLRQTLRAVQLRLPTLSLHEVPSGTKVFDWTIPLEWNIEDAYIQDKHGNKIVNFQDSNLHVVGYSTPVDMHLSGSELLSHLHSLPNLPTAIPYVTSYYKQRWGFCCSHDVLSNIIADQMYHVYIDSSLVSGSLTYGEVLIPSTELQPRGEILLSTYVCHPSMANNELSGPVVTTALAQWLLSLPKRTYSYRVIFIPETIGSITYLSINSHAMKSSVKAGFNITCVGDNRAYSFLPSRAGNSLSDQAAMHVLKHLCPAFLAYSWLDRGSDERQYCSPGIDLPVATIMRSKYGTYPEYHTSLDTLGDVVTPDGLGGGFHVIQTAIETIERNCFPLAVHCCEPQLSPRGLYSDISTPDSFSRNRLIMNILTFSDGKHDLISIADMCGVPVWELFEPLDALCKASLVKLQP